MKELYLQYLCPADQEAEQAETGISITQFPFVIGRHSNCDHFLFDPWISRHHCSFFLRDDEVWVADLGSRNGTYLNGQPLAAARPVHDGDRLALAGVPFQVRLPVQPEAPAHETGARG